MDSVDIKILESYAEFLHGLISSLEKGEMTDYREGAITGYKVALRSFEGQLKIIKIGQ